MAEMASVATGPLGFGISAALLGACLNGAIRDGALSDDASVQSEAGGIGPRIGDATTDPWVDHGIPYKGASPSAFDATFCGDLDAAASVDASCHRTFDAMPDGDSDAG